MRDLAVVEERPQPGWRFCTVDRYELARSSASALAGTYDSAACTDHATITLQLVSTEPPRPPEPPTKTTTTPVPPPPPPPAPSGCAARCDVAPGLVVGLALAGRLRRTRPRSACRGSTAKSAR